MYIKYRFQNNIFIIWVLDFYELPHSVIPYFLYSCSYLPYIIVVLTYLRYEGNNVYMIKVNAKRLKSQSK